jgi:hypothetical protein
MSAPLHLANKTNWIAVGTPNFSNSQKMQYVSMLEKLQHLYNGVQKSFMLNSCLRAQHAPTVTHRVD